MIGHHDRTTSGRRPGSRRPSTRAGLACEALDARRLLSNLPVLPAAHHGSPGPRDVAGLHAKHDVGTPPTDFASSFTPTVGQLAGIDSPGMDGGHGGPRGNFTPPAAVTAAQTALTQAASGLDLTTKATSSQLSTFQADMQAAHDGTLSQTDAQAKLQADRDALLKSIGASDAQVTSIDAAETALQTAMQANMPARGAWGGGDFGGGGHHGAPGMLG